MIVAIDGLAGSGKTSLCHCLGKKTGMVVISSGLLYRYVAFKALESHDEHRILSLAQDIILEVSSENRMQIASCTDSSSLYREAVAHHAAQIATLQKLRVLINKKLRAFMKNYSCIVEGRDATSVIAPKAALKIFLSASEEARSRRLAVRQKSSLAISHNAMQRRDDLDRSGIHLTSLPQEDVLIFDTSNLTLEKVCATLEKLIETASRNVPHGK